MIKKIAHGFSFAAGILLLSCSSSKTLPVKVDVATPDPRGAKQSWQTKMDGYVGDLDLSADESRVLVSTVSDPQTGGGKFATLVLSAAGKTIWRVDHGKRVRAQAIATDGSLVSVTDYDHRLKLFVHQGKQLFDVEAGCRPWIVGTGKVAKVYCFRDDDHTPTIAVEIFDGNGARVFSQMTQFDLLAHSVSPTGNFAVAFDGGKLKAFGADTHLAFEKALDGEVLDLAVVDQGENFSVAALTWIPKKGQRVSLFSNKGKLVAQFSPNRHIQQLNWDPASHALVGFGNGTEGQTLIFWSEEGKELWSRNVVRSADYLPEPVASGGVAVAGVFDFNPGVSVGEVVGYSLDATTPGRILWNIPLANEDQAYLFESSRQKRPSLVVVAWDDGRVGGYQVGRVAN